MRRQMRLPLVNQLFILTRCAHSSSGSDVRRAYANEESYINERLDHSGLVTGVCQEIGLAGWLDAQQPGNRQQFTGYLVSPIQSASNNKEAQQ